uniref:Uncharacterized protein n=1 Tax=Solanum tuberosum TaxID=4113 RepID=M1DNJ2_SOLTU
MKTMEETRWVRVRGVGHDGKKVCWPKLVMRRPRVADFVRLKKEERKMGFKIDLHLCQLHVTARISGELKFPILVVMDINTIILSISILLFLSLPRRIPVDAMASIRNFKEELSLEL